jgi:probable selenium-dependent hydroxylase accessory protein YqeC
MELLEEILCLGPSGVVSFVGGGGKTSLMFGLAHQLANSGRRVLTTTTTKIFVPTPEQSATVLVASDPSEILRQAESCGSEVRHLTAAAAFLDGGGKLKGFEPAAIRSLADSGLFDWILVEADGSARRPLKAPAEHEPVVPANTTVLVAVAGLEVLGSPLSEDLVFRSGLASILMGLAEGELITTNALAALFSHPGGAFKGIPSQARRCIFLNKADTPERIEGAAEVAEQLRRNPAPVAETLIVGQALNGINVRAVHPLLGRR